MIPQMSSQENPFARDAYPDGHGPGCAVVSLHGPVRDRIVAVLREASAREQRPDAADGGGDLLRLHAARAGFGKTRLLASLTDELAASAAVIDANPEGQSGLTWDQLFWRTLRTWHAPQTDSPGRLEIFARELFAWINAGLISAGTIPCTHPETARQALREQAQSLFDFQDPGQKVAQWFAANFERLLPAATPLLARAAGVTEPTASLWLHALMAYSQGKADGPTIQWDGLAWSLAQPATLGFSRVTSVVPADSSTSRLRFLEFARITSVTRPLLVVCDHLDLLHGHPAEIAGTAAVLTEISRHVARSLCILSVNDDLWERNFLPTLPSATLDRLTGLQQSLQPISETEAEQLITARLSAAGIDGRHAQSFLRRLNLSALAAAHGGTYPRAVLRHAASAWPSFATHISSSHSNRPPPPEVPNPFLLVPEEPTPAPAPPEIPTPAPPPPAIPSTSAPPRTFHQLRNQFLSGPPLPADPDRLFQLTREIGRNLAVLSWLEESPASTPDQHCGAWISPDAEIWFGSEPYADHHYWSALISHVRSRSLSRSQPVRLAIFSTPLHPAPLRSWMAADEIIAARSHFLDIHSLDQVELASLYAAHAILTPATGSDATAKANVFAATAPHISFLWKNLTRHQPAHG